MNTDTEPNEYDGRATYCPEDNKLRLYVGRVPRSEYEALRAEGWTSTPKQDCDFVATWTPDRRDTALDYAGIIEDEDQGPDERAADRAERFAMYREKRTGEAIGHADRFDAGPIAHGYQSQARAERAARRHDRIAGRACDSWGKAEYWTRRTAGVISHALHVSSPAVRMGRIKELEAELRKREKYLTDYAEEYRRWQSVATIQNEEKQRNFVEALAGMNGYGTKYTHPITGHSESLWTIAECLDVAPWYVAQMWLARHSVPRTESDWTAHLKLRISYELQMLEAQGGRAAMVEMEPGGWIGSMQIRKVNKSPATGRVVSVQVLALTRANFDKKGKPYNETNPRPMTLHTLNIERLPADTYRPPTEEDKASLIEAKKAEKAAAPKKDPCPLINPTKEDAERLAKMWNDARRADFEKRHGSMAKHYEFKPCEVREMPQAFYSEHSKGSYARAETRKLCSLGRLEERNAFYDYSGQAQRKAERGPAVCQIRTTGYDPVHIIVLNDKPQKPLPAAVWEAYAPKTQPEQKADDGTRTCTECQQASPLFKWEKSGSVLFKAGVVCPRCDMHQEGPADLFKLEA